MMDNVRNILIRLFIGMVLMAAVAGCDDDDNNGDDNLSQEDRDFVTNAGYANQAEIQLGQLALSKAEEQVVRDFAQQMVTEHTSALNELDEIGDDHDVAVPDEMDDEHKSIRSVLEGLSGYKFDSAYMHHQVLDHQKTEALFAAHDTEADDEDIRAYASKYLPAIQMHLVEAENIRVEIAPK